MQTPLDSDEVNAPAYVSTGHLPPAERVDILLAEAYERFKTDNEGKVADYIPALARTVSPGASLVVAIARHDHGVHRRYGFSSMAITELNQLL
jgi:glutaminase